MLPPRFVGLCAIGACVLQALWPLCDVVDPPLSWIGLVPLVGGIGVAVAAKRRFQRLETTVNTFHDPQKLVTDGWYSYTRNPMYLGLAAALGGVAILLGSVWGLVALVAFVAVTDRWYIRFEERRLEATFGPAWHVYRARTRRWFGRR